MAPSIGVAVEVEAGLAVRLGRDHGGGAAGVEFGPEPVDVGGPVAEQGAEGDALDKRRHADGVVALARQQHEAHQVAQRVHQGDDLGGQAATGAADGLVLCPPFAPLAFWWAVTMVPSIRAYSKSGSSGKRSKSRSNTPARAQRRKRWKTLFQRPNAVGTSRHGRPVRTRHSTASRNSRLSFAVTPLSDALPGSSDATRSQAASLTTNRSRSTQATTPSTQSLNHGRAETGIPECQRA